MAAPNIVNVTAIYAKTALVVAGTTATSIVANSAGSNKLLKIGYLVAANVNGSSAADISIYVSRAATSYYMASTVSVPADSSLDLMNKYLYLEEGDTLFAVAGTANAIHIQCSYEEIA